MDLTALRRFPDVDGTGLVAVDAADRLLLDEAAGAIADTAPGALVVLDDNYGALTLGAAQLGARGIRVHQDLLTGQRALAANTAFLGLDGVYASLGPFDSIARSSRSAQGAGEGARAGANEGAGGGAGEGAGGGVGEGASGEAHGPDGEGPSGGADWAALLGGATTILLRLPRSLDRLAELAAAIAAHADPTARVFAGGRIKHMTPTQNDVLRTVFDRVDVSHARQKCRVLTASGPRAVEARAALTRWPHTSRSDDYDLTLAAHGGVFAGTRVDIGTRLLLDHLDDLPDTDTAVDLACGSGVIGTAAARRRPNLTVLATDRSASAVASARATAAANDVADRVIVAQADGLETLADDSQQLILLNPPFHSDAALSTSIAEHLFADAGRVLAPGGELWCVWNSPLRYRPALTRLVGPTRQIARNAKFTLTASRA